MKKIIIFLFSFFVCIGLSAQFRLGRNPQDPGRMPDPEKEIGIILAEDSPIIKISGANGTEYEDFLMAGTLVIADKTSHVGTWVGICGNDVLFPKNWKPRGKIIFFESASDYQIACEKMLVRLEKKVDKLQTEVNKLLSRPSYSLAELRIMFNEALKKFHPQLEKSRFPYWKVGVTGIIIVAIIYILWPRGSDNYYPPVTVTGPSGPGVVTN